MEPDARYCVRCGTPLRELTLDARPRRVCDACGWLWMDLPQPVVLVLAVTPSGRVALTRDDRFPAARWGLVAGYIERGERPEDAALRELREETGLVGTDPIVVRGDQHGGNVLFCVRCAVPDATPVTEPGTTVELAIPVIDRMVPDSPASRMVEHFIARRR